MQLFTKVVSPERINFADHERDLTVSLPISIKYAFQGVFHLLLQGLSLNLFRYNIRKKSSIKEDIIYFRLHFLQRVVMALKIFDNLIKLIETSDQLK